MKISGKMLYSIPVVVVIVLLISFMHPEKGITNPESTMKAGASKVNITPEVPIPMSGYGNRSEPFTEVHDSLYAAALVFSDGFAKAAIITADLIGFSHDFCIATIPKIAAATGIKEDFILISANHNHGGPVNKTYTEQVSPEIETYVAVLQQKIVNAVIDANRQLQPTSIGMGTGTCKMNINRRARFADGTIWLGRNPDGPCDHEVAVLRVDDMNQKPIAILVNWPCHGTVSGQENKQITGDWPGAAARFVEKAFNGMVIVPVTAGASADINPIYGPGNNFSEIDAIGMLVGEEVVRVAKTIETQSNGNIDAQKLTIKAKGKKTLPNRSPNQKLESADVVEINIAAMKIGPVVFCGVSGELMTEIGMRIKAESPYKHTMIITHCNGSSGYLCTNQSYPEGGYEVMVSRTMPGTEYLISENLKKMIRALR